MKLATVEYTGRVRSQQHTGASGEMYRFGGDRTVEVADLRDARQFESKPNFDVTWSAVGQLAKVVEDESQDVREALEDTGYSAKQRLAKHFDGIKGNAAEEELEEALTEKAEELQQQMENQF